MIAVVSELVTIGDCRCGGAAMMIRLVGQYRGGANGAVIDPAMDGVKAIGCQGESALPPMPGHRRG